MVLAERSGRWVNDACQVAISFHITSPCYRHSSIIGTVFGEIVAATLPIIYHLGGKTAPISLLFGTVRLIEPGTRSETVTVPVNTPLQSRSSLDIRTVFSVVLPFSSSVLYPRPDSRARSMAWTRSATCSLL